MSERGTYSDTNRDRNGDDDKTEFPLPLFKTEEAPHPLHLGRLVGHRCRASGVVPISTLRSSLSPALVPDYGADGGGRRDGGIQMLQ